MFFAFLTNAMLWDIKNQQNPRFLEIKLPLKKNAKTVWK